MAGTNKIAIEIGLDTTRLVEDLRAAGDALHAAADRLGGKRADAPAARYVDSVIDADGNVTARPADPFSGTPTTRTISEGLG
jgi:hypothetical protein